MKIKKNTLSRTGVNKLIVLDVYTENFGCTYSMPGSISAALHSFCHDHHNETDATKQSADGKRRTGEYVKALIRTLSRRLLRVVYAKGA